MANIKSAKKRILITQKRTLRNRMLKSQLKTFIKKFEISSDSSKAEALSAYKIAVKKIDQAVSKGIMHKNTAARRKSQLTKKLNSIA